MYYRQQMQTRAREVLVELTALVEDCLSDFPNPTSLDEAETTATELVKYLSRAQTAMYYKRKRNPVDIPPNPV